MQLIAAESRTKERFCRIPQAWQLTIEVPSLSPVNWNPAPPFWAATQLRNIESCGPAKVMPLPSLSCVRTAVSRDSIWCEG